MVTSRAWERAEAFRDDGASKKLGTNTRLRWTFHPLGDLFVVYNYNVVDQSEDPSAGLSPHSRWTLDSTQLKVKVQYAFRN
jgi:hypothetical protein